MTVPETLVAALVAGLVGSTHCLGMCGGIAAALGMATAGEGAAVSRAFGHALVYNAARVGSYALAGALAGGLGMALGRAVHAPSMTVGLRVLTGLVLVAIGLQIAFNLRLLRPLETAGFGIWQRIAPAAAGLVRRRDLAGALGLGALWGWLPCGLVYGMLLAAAGTGGPLNGSHGRLRPWHHAGHGGYGRAGRQAASSAPVSGFPAGRGTGGRVPRTADGGMAVGDDIAWRGTLAALTSGGSGLDLNPCNRKTARRNLGPGEVFECVKLPPTHFVIHNRQVVGCRLFGRLVFTRRVPETIGRSRTVGHGHNSRTLQMHGHTEEKCDAQL